MRDKINQLAEVAATNVSRREFLGRQVGVKHLVDPLGQLQVGQAGERLAPEAVWLGRASPRVPGSAARRLLQRRPFRGDRGGLHRAMGRPGAAAAAPRDGALLDRQLDLQPGPSTAPLAGVGRRSKPLRRRRPRTTGVVRLRRRPCRVPLVSGQGAPLVHGLQELAPRGQPAPRRPQAQAHS